MDTGHTGDMGAPVQAALDRYRSAADAALTGHGGYSAWRDAGRELLATRDATATAEWLCSDRRMHDLTGPGGRRGPFGGRLDGLALRGGTGSLGFPASNPWGVPASAGPEQAIRRIWAPVADEVPAFVDSLVERAFAVAMVRHDTGISLAYLLGGSYRSDIAVDWAGASIDELMATEHVNAEICWGTSPRVISETELVPLLGRPLPGPLRRLAGIHPALRFSSAEGWLDIDAMEPYDTDADPVEPQYVVFAGHQDAAYVLDLERLDADGEPMVVCHDPNDGLRAHTGTGFWRWFGEEIGYHVRAE